MFFDFGVDVVVFEGADDLNRNEAFEHLARHLGSHFDLLSPFYEKLKRCVATGRGQRIDIEHFSSQERSAAVQFGTLLHRHGMLKDFYYHRSPKKQLRVIPTKDGQVGQFLTGGWLEIYVSLQLARRLKARSKIPRWASPTSTAATARSAQSARCSRKIAITLGTAARINNCGIRNTISAPTITTRMIKTVSDMTVRIGLSDSKKLDYIAPRFVLLALAFQGRRSLTAGNRPNSGRDHKKRVATIPTQLSSRRTS